MFIHGSLDIGEPWFFTSTTHLDQTVLDQNIPEIDFSTDSASVHRWRLVVASVLNRYWLDLATPKPVPERTVRAGGGRGRSQAPTSIGQLDGVGSTHPQPPLFLVAPW